MCPNLTILNDPSGVITSPLYPGHYPYNQSCSWQITASKGKRVKLVIEYMDIQQCGANCTCDYLEIQNGSLAGDGTPGGRTCGHRTYDLYYSDRESLKVLFVSDGNGKWWNGFRAIYTHVNFDAVIPGK